MDKNLSQRILAIRLQAMGDVVITLPYLQDLRNNLPATVQIDLLTRDETDPIQRILSYSIKFSIKGKRNFKSISFTQYFYYQNFYFGIMIL
jgi:ADP-heptose:LPS heptosyltransferase